MRSPYFFLVRPKNSRRYDNVKAIGDVDFITSSSTEDHTVSNRFGIVAALPLAYAGEVKVGDTLLVHHNVFKFYYDMRGREKSGQSFFKDDLFFIDDDQFFLYKRGDKWRSHGKYCFIKPVPPEESVILKPLEEEPLVGVVRYINQELLDLGVKEGDRVSFQPESEYTFEVEGEKLYRMFTKNITLIL